MSIRRWNPQREMNSLRDMMDRLFLERYGSTVDWPEESEGHVSIAVDMYEKEDEFVVTADLPGIKPDDINITVTGNRLTIKGKFQSRKEEKQANIHFKERRTGSFQRTVPLPDYANTDEIDASFEEGTLILTIPKTEQERPRQIPVKNKDRS